MLANDPHSITEQRKCSVKDLVSYGIQHKYWDKDFHSKISKNVKFTDENEHWAFLLMVAKLIHENVDGFLLTDHNTFTGYSSVNAAIKEYKEYSNRTLNVIRGIEISCGDSIHVIGIFFSDKSKEKFQNWFEKSLVSVKDGTFQTSISVLNEIAACGGIAYPAHLNTAPLFGKDNAYSSGYKKELLTLSSISVYGVKTIEGISGLKSRLQQVASGFNLYPILEDDSHSVPTLGDHYIWLKCKAVNSRALENAFRDPQDQICNSKVQPSTPKNKIISLFVDGKGFLGKGKPEVIRFSNGLTSLIGGRGVGKSTILKCLHFLMNAKVENTHELRHILEQGTLCAHVINNGNEFYIYSGNSEATTGPNNQSLIDRYVQTERDTCLLSSPREIQKKRWGLLKGRLQIFEGDLKLTNEIKQSSKMKKIFENLKIQSFQASTLIDAAQRDKISPFIRKTIEQTGKYKMESREREIPKNFTAGDIDLQLSFLKRVYHRREKKIKPLLNAFNEKEQGKLHIEMYFRKDLNVNQQEIFWLKVLGFELLGHENLENSFGEWKISRQDVLDLFMKLSEENGVLGSISIIINRDIDQLVPVLMPIVQSKSGNFNWIEKNDVIQGIDNFLESIVKLFHSNVKVVKQYLNDRIMKINGFSLEFNVWSSSHAESTKKCEFHSVADLSMGQTIVAMLSFVLSMSSLVGVANSILLDQPEDNLDSQYIYNNLVKDLVKLKSQRQVILATHNSTIVVNAGSELVVSLNSNGIHGWIDKQGYTAEERILREIIAVMEGGMTAMKNKMALYRTLN